jgi:hypothetical protein
MQSSVRHQASSTCEQLANSGWSQPSGGYSDGGECCRDGPQTPIAGTERFSIFGG